MKTWKEESLVGKKVLSLVLALTLLLSLCAPGALAVEPTDTQLKVVIDLSAYIGSVNGKFKYGGGFKTNELTIDANESNEIILGQHRTKSARNGRM